MNSFNKILCDFRECFNNFHIWIIIPFYDIKARYRRTVIGPFWLTLGTATTILGMGAVWGSIFGVSLQEFLPYVAAGMVIWTFISSILNESCYVFTSQRSIIHNVKLSFFIHIMNMISRNIIIMFHNFFVIIAVFVICRHPLNLEFLWVFPGFILLILNSFWVGIFIGIVATRYRDIAAVITNISTLIMIATPIMWQADRLQGNRKIIATLNPFAHMISIIRDPLLGQSPSLESYFIIIGILVIGLLLSLWLYKKFVHRIVFWI